MTDKVLKARLIIAKLLASKIFLEWENRTRDDIIAILQKYNRELELGINPESVIKTMHDYGIIHCNGSYEGDPIYSTRKNNEPRHL